MTMTAMGGRSSAVSPEEAALTNNNNSSKKRRWLCCCSGGRGDSVTEIGTKGSDGEDRPSVEEVKRWAKNFDAFLRNKYGILSFRDFLRTQYGEENLNFWLAVEEFRHTEASTCSERARAIYEDYISTLSATEVSLDAKIRREIDENMSEPSLDSFRVGQEHIYKLMYQDCFPRYLKSKHYKKLLK